MSDIPVSNNKIINWVVGFLFFSLLSILTFLAVSANDKLDFTREQIIEINTSIVEIQGEIKITTIQSDLNTKRIFVLEKDIPILRERVTRLEER